MTNSMKSTPKWVGASIWTVVCAFLPEASNNFLPSLINRYLPTQYAIIALFSFLICKGLPVLITFAGIYHLLHHKNIRHYLTIKNVSACVLMPSILYVITSALGGFLYSNTAFVAEIASILTITEIVCCYVLIYLLTIQPKISVLFSGKKAFVFYGCLLIFAVIYDIYIRIWQARIAAMNAGDSLTAYVQMLLPPSTITPYSILPGIIVFYLLWVGTPLSTHDET